MSEPLDLAPYLIVHGDTVIVRRAESERSRKAHARKAAKDRALALEVAAMMVRQ